MTSDKHQTLADHLAEHLSSGYRPLNTCFQDEDIMCLPADLDADRWTMSVDRAYFCPCAMGNVFWRCLPAEWTKRTVLECRHQLFFGFSTCKHMDYCPASTKYLMSQQGRLCTFKPNHIPNKCNMQKIGRDWKMLLTHWSSTKCMGEYNMAFFQPKLDRQQTWF